MSDGTSSSAATSTRSPNDFRQWVIANHLPLSSHGGIPDTSLMMYLGGDAWVRKDKMTAGDPVLPPGTPQNPNTPRVNNGILSDPRPSTASEWTL